MQKYFTIKSVSLIVKLKNRPYLQLSIFNCRLIVNLWIP